MNILVCDDEENIVDLVELYLIKEGFKVYKAYNGIDGFSIFEKENIDLCILDINMPGINGFRLIQKIRETSIIPVIFLTAKSDDKDKVLGLDLGGDDYITKPFSEIELNARVKAHLRRNYKFNTKTKKADDTNNIIVNGNYKIDTDGLIFYINDEPVDLKVKEYQLIEIFMKNKGRILKREIIFETIWGELYNSSSANTIMVHLSNLRNKIGDNSKKPFIIKTYRGLGYKMEKF